MKKKIFLFSSLSLVVLLIPTFCLVSCSEDNPNKNSVNDIPVVNTTIHSDTSIKNEINAIDLNWNEMNELEIYAKYSSDNLIQFILNHLSKFINGETELISNANDIKVSFNSAKSGNNFLTIELTVLANRWYKDNKVQVIPLSQNIKIFNIKELPETIDSTGGQLVNSQLDSSSYKEIVDLFNFKSTTYLPSLTNESLNNILKKVPDFKNLSVEIQNDSKTSTGELVLNLSGTYKKQQILNEKITVGGFNKIDQNNKSIKLSKIVLNLNNWFENLMPINSSQDKDVVIKAISSDDWINKYLSSALVFDQNYLLIGELQDLVKEGMNFSLTTNLSNDSIEFTISNATYQNKKYDSQQKMWINDNLLTFAQAYPKTQSVLIPTLEDAKNFLLDKSYVNEAELKLHYPSYYIGVANYWNKNDRSYFVDNLLVKNDYLTKIGEKYFQINNNDKLLIAISNDGIFANDFKNVLNFKILLLFNDLPQWQLKSKSFNCINLSKNINDNPNLDINRTNTIFIKQDGSIYNKVKQYLLKNFKNEIDKVYQSNSGYCIEIGNANRWMIIPQILQTNIINFYNTSDNVYKNWNSINKIIEPRIFNLPINISFTNQIQFEKENTLNYYTQLFWFDDTTSVAIDSIQYTFADQIKFKIENVHENAIKISFNGSTNIGFSSNLDQNFKTEFSFILPKSQWK
ncbi:hypothetical protein [Mycoplasmoides alvi]|uniref:hypothetical protein n=1 Tax=Mycoplasmoides alvi TaxID=78580 RepID=UPI00051B3C63|nr:hypothetical protein [Mycoplasmoides alvi]